MISQNLNSDWINLFSNLGARFRTALAEVIKASLTVRMGNLKSDLPDLLLRFLYIYCLLTLVHKFRGEQITDSWDFVANR